MTVDEAQTNAALPRILQLITAAPQIEVADEMMSHLRDESERNVLFGYAIYRFHQRRREHPEGGDDSDLVLAFWNDAMVVGYLLGCERRAEGAGLWPIRWCAEHKATIRYVNAPELPWPRVELRVPGASVAVLRDTLAEAVRELRRQLAKQRKER